MLTTLSRWRIVRFPVDTFSLAYTVTEIFFGMHVQY